MSSKCWVGLFGVLVASSAHAEPEPWDHGERQMPRMSSTVDISELPGRSICFPSGLRVLAQAGSSEGIVFVGTVFGAGAGHDPPELRGRAHVLEHLWFRSDAPHGHNVWDQLAQRGTWRNAYTYRDRTTYLTGGDVALLAELLELEGRRLTDPLRGVDEATFAVEREVVRNELRRGHDDGFRLLSDHVAQKLFAPGHPYAGPQSGTHDSLDRMTLSDLEAFAEEHYRPDMASVHVVGDIVPGGMARAVAAAFPRELLASEAGGAVDAVACDDRPPPAQVMPMAPVDPHPSELEGPVQSAQAVLAWQLPAGFTPEAALAESVLVLIEVSMRYVKNIDDVGCFLHEATASSVGYCIGDTRGALSAGTLLRSMENAVDMVFSAPNTNWNKTHQSVRWILGGRMIQANDLLFQAGRSDLPERMAAYHFTGSTSVLTDRFGEMTTPAVGDAMAMFDRWFGIDRATRVVVRPLETVDVVRLGTPVEPLSAPLRMRPQETHALEIAGLRELAGASLRPQYHTYKLDNGLDVVHVQGGSPGFSEVSLVMPAGVSWSPEPAAASWIPTLISDRYGRFGYGWFSLGDRYVGGDWVTVGGERTVRVGVTGSSGSLDSLLYLVRRRVEQARIKREGRRSWLRNRRKLLREVSLIGEVQADQWRLTQLMGDHPGRTDLRPESLAARRAASTRTVRRWWRTHAQPEGSVLLVVTRRSPETVRRMVELWWSDWEGDEEGEAVPVRPVRPLPPAPERITRVVVEPAMGQHLIELGCQVRRGDGVVRPAEALAAAWLSQRIVQEIRENRGLSYSPGAWTQAVAGAGVLLHVSARVQPDGLDLAIAVIETALSDLAEGRVNARELELLAETSARHMRFEARSSVELGARVALDLVEPALAEVREGWLDALHAVDVAAVSEVGKACLGHEAITLTGPPTDALMARAAP